MVTVHESSMPKNHTLRSVIEPGEKRFRSKYNIYTPESDDAGGRFQFSCFLAQAIRDLEWWCGPRPSMPKNHTFRSVIEPGEKRFRSKYNIYTPESDDAGGVVSNLVVF